jgi:hypothetical protein
MGGKWMMALAACIGLAVPANAASAGLFSATRKVIAILADELFLGEATGHLSGAGTFAIYSQKYPALTCLGQFTSSALLGGAGEMRCSDGTTATFSFKRLSVFRGYGAGTYGRGAMSFTYGIAAEEAGRYLTVPEGKKLVQRGTEPELIDAMETAAGGRTRTGDSVQGNGNGQRPQQ